MVRRRGRRRIGKRRIENDLDRSVKRNEGLCKTCTYAASIKEAGTASLDELRFSL
jgi:hypothetical protein